jgi:hypothetical protein
MNRPPKLALGLLQLFASEPDELIGDLTETFRKGYSRWWYWRQVIAALTIAAWRDCRHSFAAASVFLTAIMVMWCARRSLPLARGWR